MNGFPMIATDHLGDAKEKTGMRNGLRDPFHAPGDVPEDIQSKILFGP